MHTPRFCKNRSRSFPGKASELAAELGLSEDEFGAFADGINTSLESPVNVDELEATAT